MRALSAAMCFGLLVLVGCQSKVTKANFDKIAEGMSLEEVQKILGEGKQQGARVDDTARRGGNTLVWASDKGTITIHFVDGKVKNKSARGI